jgi:hypothetical protein
MEDDQVSDGRFLAELPWGDEWVTIPEREDDPEAEGDDYESREPVYEQREFDPYDLSDAFFINAFKSEPGGIQIVSAVVQPWTDNRGSWTGPDWGPTFSWDVSTLWCYELYSDQFQRLQKIFNATDENHLLKILTDAAQTDWPDAVSIDDLGAWQWFGSPSFHTKMIEHGYRPDTDKDVNDRLWSGISWRDLYDHERLNEILLNGAPDAVELMSVDDIRAFLEL